MSRTSIAALWAIVSLVGCDDPSGEPEDIEAPQREPSPREPERRGADPKPFTIESPAFGPDDAPSAYPVGRADRSPPLRWSHVPAGTESLAIVVVDRVERDRADPSADWVHWVVFNLPADLRELPAGAALDLPPTAEHGLNDWNEVGWRGPAPRTDAHPDRLFVELYALDTRLDLALPTKEQLEAEMEGHVRAKTETALHFHPP